MAEGVMDLYKYLSDNALRVPASDPSAADVIFFAVKKGDKATAEGLRAALACHKGAFCECDPFGGHEHSYIELGAWVGDQGAALTMMGLGAALGMWRLLTPNTILGKDAPADLVQQMAGMGYVCIQA